MPRGYHPELELKRPDSLANNNMEWHNLALTQEEVKTKHDTISFYKSQIQYSPSYLFTFARTNELFEDFPAIRLNKQDSGEIMWHDLKNPMNIKVDPEHKKDAEKSITPDIAYAVIDNKLLVRLELGGKIENGGILAR